MTEDGQSGDLPEDLLEDLPEDLLPLDLLLAKTSPSSCSPSSSPAVYSSASSSSCG